MNFLSAITLKFWTNSWVVELGGNATTTETVIGLSGPPNTELHCSVPQYWLNLLSVRYHEGLFYLSITTGGVPFARTKSVKWINTRNRSINWELNFTSLFRSFKWTTSAQSIKKSNWITQDFFKITALRSIREFMKTKKTAKLQRKTGEQALLFHTQNLILL